jgi:anti-anti-sigma factor
VRDGLPRRAGDGGQEVGVSEDAEPIGGEILHVEARQERRGTTIVLAGEFDMTGTDRFRDLVSEALAGSPRSVTVDAHGLTFIDSSGLLALLRAQEAAAEAGVAFRISEPSPALRRLVEVAGVEDLLPGAG